MTAILDFRFRPNGATPNGKVYTYIAGTYLLKNSYPTQADAINETNVNDNPVILDEHGEATIFIKGPTKIVLKDAENNQLWTLDDLDSSEDNILDDNGNPILEFEGVADAVNGLNMANSPTTPLLSAVGTDSNIGIEIFAKADGKTVIFGNFNITTGDVTANNITLSGDINITSGDFNLGSGNVIIGSPNDPLDELPIGMVTWNAGTDVPSGWLECNGAAVSRTTYDALFAVIGTAFGSGDGITTFNLPNQARRTLVGKGGSSSGTLGNTIGSTGGAETHTLTEAETPPHNHTYDPKSREAHSSSSAPDGTIRHLTAVHDSYTSSSYGGSEAHNILQPSLVSMLMIKV